MKRQEFFDSNYTKATFSQEEVFSILYDISKGKLDIEYVKACMSRKDKIRLGKLWNLYKGYEDNNFFENLKKRFHAALWEMYVGTYLISNKNYKIDRKSIPRDEGPDFVLENGEWMECVACTWGHNPKLPYSDGLPHDYPKDEIQLRITGAFSEKKQQYIRWDKKGWFDKKSPYILFINTYLGRLNNNAEIYKILYGIGDPYAVVQRTKETIKIVNEGTTEEKHLMKNNTIEVPKDLFKNLDYQFISAVVFSNNHVVNYSDPIGDDLRVIYNPMATNKCELSDIKEYRKGPSDA